MDNVTEFIDQLKKWGQRERGEQRAVMAELRRGLQEFPHIAPAMHRYVASYAGTHDGWRRQTYYLLAALFARYHSGSREPNYGGKWDNMGSAFDAVARANPDARPAIERRFNALLTAHPQDLHYHLRQAIAFLHGQKADPPINWEGLFWDIWHWDDDEQRPRVQDRWARSFWGRQTRAAEAEEATEEADE